MAIARNDGPEIKVLTLNSSRLNKFKLTPLERDQTVFKSLYDFNDGVSIPVRCPSSGDHFRIELVGDRVRIGAFFPKPMDEEEIFILPLIGYNLALKVAKAVVGANAALAGFSSCPFKGERNA
jgi:hypothetical protein